MPIFLRENQALKHNTYEVPKKLISQLKDTLTQYGQYTDLPGYKRLKSIIDPSYNNRSNVKRQSHDGKHISYSDLKKIDFDFRHMNKNPKDIKRILNGGDKLENWVKTTLNRERTRVKPELSKKKAETRSKTPMKPPVKPTQPVKPVMAENIMINESYNEHVYIQYLNDYGPYYVFDAFEAKDSLWGSSLINPSMYKQALLEFTKYGKFIRFPSDYVYKWMGGIMKNTALLRTCTDLCGHSQYFPVEDFIDYYFEGEESLWENYKQENNLDDNDFYAVWDFLDARGFGEWAVLPDGSDAISDYGIEPIEKLINEYNSNLSPEKVLVIINKILDVTHQRGDLASIFIHGGSHTLSGISEAKKTKKIFIPENKLYLLSNL